MRATPEQIASDLEELVAAYRRAGWFSRISIGHVIVVKVVQRLPTIVRALRGNKD